MQVGKEAPDFTTRAYHKGEIKEITLSDYKRAMGSAVLLSW